MLGLPFSVSLSAILNFSRAELLHGSTAFIWSILPCRNVSVVFTVRHKQSKRPMWSMVLECDHCYPCLWYLLPTVTNSQYLHVVKAPERGQQFTFLLTVHLHTNMCYIETRILHLHHQCRAAHFPLSSWFPPFYVKTSETKVSIFCMICSKTFISYLVSGRFLFCWPALCWETLSNVYLEEYMAFAALLHHIPPTLQKKMPIENYTKVTSQSVGTTLSHSRRILLFPSIQSGIPSSLSNLLRT